MAKRILTLKNAYDKKHKTFPFTRNWKVVFGEPERHGIWLIYGVDKNGKTTFALMLAQYLSSFSTVLYISAEEGISRHFVSTLNRLNITPDNKRLRLADEMSMDELRERLSKPRTEDIIFIDNITVFVDELKNGALRQLVKDFPNKLFVFLAHEENKEPYTATAKLARRLAKVIMRVKGLAVEVGGRVPGGVLTINEEKAKLFYGDDISQQNEL